MSELKIDFKADFRQVMLKLANAYQPSSPSTRFSSVDEIANSLVDDFSKQLKPLVSEKLSQVLSQIPLQEE